MCQTFEALTRTKAAFRASVATLFDHVEKSGSQAFLWTFTLRECLSVDEAFKRWNKLAKSLWKLGLKLGTHEQTIYGIRVAELHPGGHGVHFHTILNRRVSIWAVRRRAEKFGFFWIDVRRASRGRMNRLGSYLSKYLSKEDRAPCMKGRRLWQAFGQWGQTRCKDIELDSEFVRYFHARRRMLEGEQAVALLQQRSYRLEHNLETMEKAKEWVWRVRCGLERPLAPELWFGSEPTMAAPDLEDWQAAWDALGTCDARGTRIAELRSWPDYTATTSNLPEIILNFATFVEA